MWTWFGIAILARVLMANHEVGQYPSASSLSHRITEDVGGGGELPGEELSSRQSTIKPETKSPLLLQWKNDHNFQDLKNPYENSINNLIRKLSSSGSKMFQNNPKNPEDLRDKRSSIRDEENEPASAWISWAHTENKALPFRNLQDPWQEIKKSRSFSPWGGKRVTVYGQGPKVRRPIRIPFNSWGGKRSFSSGDEKKRMKFSSWGGKRGWYIGAEEALEKGEEKRTKFNAWGGKRSKNGERDDEEIKRNRFNAWGGKRNVQNDKRTPEDVDAKKSVFNAWGGKRSFIDNEDEENGLKYDGNMFGVEKPGIEKIGVENMMKNVEKEDEEEEENADDEENRNEISSENAIIDLPKEKKGSRDDYIHKISFNPWGGRKRGENDLDMIETGMNLILPESHHHHTRFWPWGG